MHRRAIVLGCAAVALAACSRQDTKTEDAPSAQPTSDPAEVVRALYGPYLGQGAQPAEFRDQAPWSADLWAQLEAMVARSNAINEPILDFDPVIDAQEGDLANLNVTTEAVAENSHAVVRASFTNSGQPREVVYDLVWQDGAWRVDNIRTAAWDLRQIAAAPNADAIPQ
jgi:hypothetical protein